MGPQGHSQFDRCWHIFDSVSQVVPVLLSTARTKNYTTTVWFKALKDAKAHMLKHFGTTEVKLGEYQKLVRGDKALPVFGLNDVVTAMSSVPYKDGKVKVVAGESYIELVGTPDGPEIESVISYGSSIILNHITAIKWNCTHNSKRKK